MVSLRPFLFHLPGSGGDSCHVPVLKLFSVFPPQKRWSKLGVDRLSVPILSILPIIDIGHFQNRFADNFIYIFFLYYANKHTIYR